MTELRNNQLACGHGDRCFILYYYSLTSLISGQRGMKTWYTFGMKTWYIFKLPLIMRPET